MNIVKKSSLLFLICTGLYLMLSLALALLFGSYSMNVKMLINAIAVSVPAFLLPALAFRRRENFPRFGAPPLIQVIIACAIGVGCILLNEALSLFTEGIFYGLDIESNSTTASTIADMDPVIMMISLVLIPPLSEEFIMRGTLLESFRRSSPVWGAVLTSLLFGLLHAAPSSLMIYLGLGMVFAFVYLVSRNVWLTVTVHLVNNLSAVITVLAARFSGQDAEVLISDSIHAAESLADPAGYYIINAISLAVAAGSIIVPLLFLLRYSCKKRGLGMYAPGQDSLEDGSILPLEEGMLPEKRRPELLSNLFLWMCIGLLVVLNVISGLSEFGVIE